jgi:hypothetical protein
MSKTTTITIDFDLIQALDARRRDGETRTARLESDLADYHALLNAGLRQARRRLTRAEASVLLDTQNGAGQAPVHWLGKALAHQVEDAIALDHLADKWSVDGPQLIAKLEEIGDMACIALVDWAARAWGDSGDALKAAEIFGE